MNTENITALILSAGKSTRMQGQFKPLLPLGDVTILERAIRLFRSAGVADIRVITGHRGDEVAESLKPLAVPCLFNKDYETGMFSSVMMGVSSLEPSEEAFFMLPVDIPLVRRQTVTELLRAYSEKKDRILYPNFRGERGHPPLIPARYAEEIKGWHGDGGLRAFLEQHEHNAADVAVADECMLMDLDTPANYQALLARYERYDIPSESECVALMREVLAVDEGIFRHCEAVACIASRIGQAMNAAGCHLDSDLITAAGLVHDLARTKPRHAEAGATMLREMGFPKLADIVAVHMDITIREDRPVTEAEVVHLADKLVRGDQPVSVEGRFAKKMEKYGGNPQARAKIEGRLNNALAIRRRIEQITGLSLSAITEAGR